MGLFSFLGKTGKGLVDLPGKVIDKVLPGKELPTAEFHPPVKYKWDDYVKPIVRPIVVLGLLGITIYLLANKMHVPYYLWMLDILIIPRYFGLRSYEKKQGVS